MVSNFCGCKLLLKNLSMFHACAGAGLQDAGLPAAVAGAVQPLQTLMTQAIVLQQQQHATVVQSQQQMQQQIQQVLDTLGTLMHRTSEELRLARMRNAAAMDPSSPLFQVPHPNTGVLPAADIFPATRRGLTGMPEPDLGALLGFYNLPLAGDVAIRRNALGSFLGVPGI